MVAGDLDMSAQESRNTQIPPLKGTWVNCALVKDWDDLDVEVGYAPQTGCTDTKFSRVLFGHGLSIHERSSKASFLAPPRTRGKKQWTPQGS